MSSVITNLLFFSNSIFGVKIPRFTVSLRPFSVSKEDGMVILTSLTGRR
jgi:hypothetical protein